MRGIKIRRKTIFLTGFPGFIASRLILELIRQYPTTKIYALVLTSQKKKAEYQLLKDSNLRSHVEIVLGDISKKHLGLDLAIYTELRKKVTDVFHLAAIYHLEVPKNLAWKVNVIGTYNIIQFALKCPNLFSFTFFSSMVAVGRKKGQIPEDELDTTVSLHENHYEITKHVSEYLVRKYINQLPTIIIRPAAVIGDSKTGVTDKFDGVYHILEYGRGGRELGRFLPKIQVKNSQMNIPVVPVNYLAKAVSYLPDQEACIGHTFHLGQFKLPLNVFSNIILNKKPLDPALLIPNRLIQVIIHSPFYRYLISNKLLRLIIRKGFQIPVELLQSIDSYDWGQYSTANSTKFLEPAGITCPQLEEYADVIAEFQKKNRKKRRLRR